MRTAGDLRRAAAGTGARLEQVERVRMPGGRSTLAARFSYADPWAAARLLKNLSDEDATDPVVHAWSRAILAATAAARGERLGSPELSEGLERAYARAIHRNVQRHIKFTPEPGETFQSARETMELGAGDCDCHARLVYALGRAGGLRAALGFFDVDGEPVHVAAKLGPRLEWAETTIPARFGEHPHAALRRLKASGRRRRARTDIGAIYGLGFSTGSTHDDVVALQAQLAKQQTDISAAVVGCSRLDASTKNEWYALARRVVPWVSMDPDDTTLADGAALGKEMNAYGLKLQAAGCANVPQGVALPAAPAPSRGLLDALTTEAAPVLEAVKWVSVAAAVVVAGLAARDVAHVFR